MTTNASEEQIDICTDPEHVIRLSEPVLVTGMMGITRRVTSIGLSPDDPPVIAALRKGAAAAS